MHALPIAGFNAICDCQDKLEQHREAHQRMSVAAPQDTHNSRSNILLHLIRDLCDTQELHSLIVFGVPCRALGLINALASQWTTGCCCYGLISEQPLLQS